MPQIFHRRANAFTSILLVGILLLLVTASVVLIALDHSPYANGTGSIPQQPVPFSHQHHVGGLGIDCRYCHTSVEQSSFAGLPDTHTCMTCHKQLWTRAELLQPVRQSYENDEPLAWTRVYDLADYVYFNHQAHVNNGVGCESCHGRVDRMPLTRQATPLTMEWCLDCHRDPGPNLRPKNAITAMGFEPGEADASHPLLDIYDTPTDRLTECVTCHR